MARPAVEFRSPRSWRTWQLLAAAGVALVVGVGLGASESSPGTSVTRTFALPPDARTSPTPASGAATPTTVAALLLAPVQVQGPGSTGTFDAPTGGWRLDWAYDCTAAPGGAGNWTATVGGATRALVEQSGTKAQGVATGTTTGPVRLEVATPAGCTWAVEVAAGP